MMLVKPGYEILHGLNPETLKLIELAGRTCYRSEDKITEHSANAFCKKISGLGHESVIEHSSVTVEFITDRGVTHELVRHRLCAFSQESTRYCNYGKKGLTFILPPWVNLEAGKYSYWSLLTAKCSNADRMWLAALLFSGTIYNRLLEWGWQPQQARAVLPNSLKTKIVTTCNLREWKHIFKLRCSKAAHPQIREIMIPLRDEFAKVFPEIFK